MLSTQRLRAQPRSGADEITTRNTFTAVRRFGGPQADELFMVCRPKRCASDVARQTDAAYGALLDLLAAWGASPATLVTETVCLRDIRRDLAVVNDVRRRVLGRAGSAARSSATTFVEQPPLDEGACLELSAFAIVPRHERGWSITNLAGSERCGCGVCPRPNVRIVRIGEQTHLYAGNIYGRAASAAEEPYDLFCAAEGLLQQAGMSFQEVVRTWIYLQDIDRHYAELNRARRAFFRHSGIRLRPASTGVGGGLFPAGHGFSMSLYAVKSTRPLQAGLMSSPTLSEPWLYGSEFSRGLKLTDANKVALYLSGTASVDEAGHTAHPGNLEAQLDRMLLNISSLLAAHGASFCDLVSAVTYLSRGTDPAVLRALLKERGFNGFPNALVKAPLCRRDLLCEAEAVALLPLSRHVVVDPSCRGRAS